MRDGDHYVVNGQKTWTTLGQYADWIFCLARTDKSAKKQMGISFILIDMKTHRASPSVRSRRLTAAWRSTRSGSTRCASPSRTWSARRTRAGTTPSSCWATSATGIARVGVSKARIRRIKQLAALERVGDITMLDEPHFRQKLAAVEVELKALEMTQLRVVADERNRERGKPNPASSILKLKGSELQQATTELLMDVVGPYILPYDDHEDGSNEPPVGPALRGGSCADLLQLAQDLNLWRVERNPAQHRSQGDLGF